MLDAEKCISYLTIESKSNIPDEFKGKMSNYIFGCDICQLVCPWNKFAIEHSEVDFYPGSKLLDMDKDDWKNLDIDKFNELFVGSAVNRAQFAGLKRNIDFLSDGLDLNFNRT
jgi:epoxyqueuosine reductase